MATWVPSWHKSLSEKRRIKHFAVPPQDRQDMIHQVHSNAIFKRSSLIIICHNRILCKFMQHHHYGPIPDQVEWIPLKSTNSRILSTYLWKHLLQLRCWQLVFAGPSSRPWRLRHRNRSPAVDFCSNSGWLRSNPRPQQIQACLKWYPVRALAIRNKLKRGMKCQVPDTPIFPEQQIHKIMGVWHCLTFSTIFPDQIAGTWRSTSFFCVFPTTPWTFCVLFELLWIIWGSTSYMDRPWITCVLVWIGGMDPPVGSGYGSGLYILTLTAICEEQCFRMFQIKWPFVQGIWPHFWNNPTFSGSCRVSEPPWF